MSQLKEWESNDLSLDYEFILKNIEFIYIDQVKNYMLDNKKKHKFLNKLYRDGHLSDTDYDYLMKWYYKRKTYKGTPEEREKTKLFFDKLEKEELQKYNQIIKNNSNIN
jgi:hypothetical protein